MFPVLLLMIIIHLLYYPDIFKNLAGPIFFPKCYFRASPINSIAKYRSGFNNEGYPKKNTYYKY